MLDLRYILSKPLKYESLIYILIIASAQVVLINVEV